MNNYDEVAVHDTQLLEEIELLSDLIVMATNADLPLSQTDIDQALGVDDPVLDAPV